jgi:alpha-1,3-mannosyl-glycoprotein beta-1,2-N-acetylglucosaminyltransferase
MFEVRNYPYVIIVEDDLDVAPDFFSFFAMGRQVLQRDPTVWCISGTPRVAPRCV